MSYAITPIQGLAILGRARWVTDQGDPVIYQDSPVISSFSHSCGAADLTLYGSISGIAKQVALAVLGESCAFFADPTNVGAHA